MQKSYPIKQTEPPLLPPTIPAEVATTEAVEYIQADLFYAQDRPWFFQGGSRYPKPAIVNRKTRRRMAKLFPSEDPEGDRITNQLMFVPPNYNKIKKQKRWKTILLYNGLAAWNAKEGMKLILVDY